MPYPVLEDLAVMDPERMERLPADGQTMGEVMIRGNIVMKGYFKNPKATAEAFAGGWFHSGDLGVIHPDTYIQIKDRSKDVIISGGENISSIDVEEVLYRHPAILEAAVVARPDGKWGETPCAFVTLRDGAAVSEAEIITFCRERMAHFKAPRTVVFGLAVTLLLICRPRGLLDEMTVHRPRRWWSGVPQSASSRSRSPVTAPLQRAAGAAVFQ